MYKLIILLASLFALPATAHSAPRNSSERNNNQVKVGMCDTSAYLPLLQGKRVAVLANHTSIAPIGENSAPIHLVDLLHSRGITLAGIFSPEHGFRGTADAGEGVKNSIDKATGTPILSLYNGKTHHPTPQAMASFDLLVVDMQDIGLRFYTYYITMLRMMEACSKSDIPVIVLDRPNPNGHHIDGPILDMSHKSGVGALPIPVLHGLTMGEIARMAIGEGWAKPCKLRVITCQNYTHSTPYTLPVAPSPNLPTMRSIYLYPSICLFEGTPISLGRGTDSPFEIYGHPLMQGCDFSFTPRPTPGSKQPPLNGQKCFGVDLRSMSESQAREVGFSLSYLLDGYRNLAMGDKFFIPMFEKLIGVSYIREMILAGATEDQIRARWHTELEAYKVSRAKYLLYK